MSTEITSRPGKADKSGPVRAANSVRVNAAAYRQLTASADKLGITNGEYASAAIAYFAESGLDPTKEQRLGFAGVAEKVAVVEQNVRSQNHEIGTRLIQIMRTWEKNSYAFMQQQQASLTNYLEMIESNILQHQVLIETNYFAPMVEHLFRVNIEALTTRGLASRLFIEATQKPDSTRTPTERYQDQKAQLDSERDIMLTNQTREYLKTNSVPLPKPTRRPAVTPVPAPPPKPAPAAPAAPPKS